MSIGPFCLLFRGIADVVLINRRNQRLQCSHFEPATKYVAGASTTCATSPFSSPVIAFPMFAVLRDMLGRTVS